MIFHTRTGSIYELDETNKRARRRHGGSGTVRLTDEWRPYAEAIVNVGYQALVVWTDETEPLEGDYDLDEYVPVTQTSVVTKVENEIQSS